MRHLCLWRRWAAQCHGSLSCLDALDESLLLRPGGHGISDGRHLESCDTHGTGALTSKNITLRTVIPRSSKIICKHIEHLRNRYKSNMLFIRNCYEEEWRWKRFGLLSRDRTQRFSRGPPVEWKKVHLSEHQHHWLLPGQFSNRRSNCCQEQETDTIGLQKGR